MPGEGASSGGASLNRHLAEAGLPPLDALRAARFENYLSLFIRWNSRMNLSAVRDLDGIVSRHFVESIACACALPAGVGTLLDFGSGGGLPGIPIALCRPEIAVTLAESQGKKAAFLQEAVRTLGITAKVFAGRGETLSEQFDCVTLRAVDNMAVAVHEAAKLVVPAGWIALMTTSGDVSKMQQSAGPQISWEVEPLLPGGGDLVLALGRRQG